MAILCNAMKERLKKRIGEILVEDGVISPEHISEALEHQKKEGGMIGQILIKLGYLSEETLLAALGKQLNIPYIPLMNYSINLDAVKRFPEEFLRKNLLLIFDEDEKRSFVAMSDPLNMMALDEIEKQTKLKLQVFISTPTEIMNVIDMAFSSGSSIKNLKKAG